MSDDIVVELDAELALIEELPYRVPIHLLARRARDEIVRLRRDCSALANWAVPTARDEALEEAAAIAQRTRTVAGRETAIAIRKLKGVM